MVKGIGILCKIKGIHVMKNMIEKVIYNIKTNI